MDSKVCKACGLEKPLDDFYLHKQMADGHLNFCKDCVRKRTNDRAAGMRDKLAAQERDRRRDPAYRQRDIESSRRYYYENHERLLQQHREWRDAHKDYRRGYDRQRYLDRLMWLHAQKRSRGCQRCGVRHPACLDYHHRDPATKLFNIGEASIPGRWRIEQVEAEMGKCDILCRNCHAILHFEERRGADPPRQTDLPLW